MRLGSWTIGKNEESKISKIDSLENEEKIVKPKKAKGGCVHERTDIVIGHGCQLLFENRLPYVCGTAYTLEWDFKPFWAICEFAQTKMDDDKSKREKEFLRCETYYKSRYPQLCPREDKDG